MKTRTKAFPDLPLAAPPLENAYKHLINSLWGFKGFSVRYDETDIDFEGDTLHVAAAKLMLTRIQKLYTEEESIEDKKLQEILTQHNLYTIDQEIDEEFQKSTQGEVKEYQGHLREKHFSKKTEPVKENILTALEAMRLLDDISILNPPDRGQEHTKLNVPYTANSVLARDALLKTFSDIKGNTHKSFEEKMTIEGVINMYNQNKKIIENKKLESLQKERLRKLGDALVSSNNSRISGHNIIPLKEDFLAFSFLDRDAVADLEKTYKCHLIDDEEGGYTAIMLPRFVGPKNLKRTQQAEQTMQQIGRALANIKEENANLDSLSTAHFKTAVSSLKEQAAAQLHLYHNHRQASMAGKKEEPACAPATLRYNLAASSQTDMTVATEEILKSILGENHAHITLIGRKFEEAGHPADFEVAQFGKKLTIYSDLQTAQNIKNVLIVLQKNLEKNKKITVAIINDALKKYFPDIFNVQRSFSQQIRALKPAQQPLIDALDAMLQMPPEALDGPVFALGASGTGKTFLPVAAAATALKSGKIERIVISRPAVEAGEHLGFLPGTPEEKISPFLQPIFDALYKVLGVEQTQKLLDKQVIQIVPLAFMRGRTFENAFIVFDEAQNATVTQTDLFMTRPMGSYVTVGGDLAQCDLPRNRDGSPPENGLSDMMEMIETDPVYRSQVTMVRLDNDAVVRGKLVKNFLDAKERYKHHKHQNRLEKNAPPSPIIVVSGSFTKYLQSPT